MCSSLLVVVPGPEVEYAPLKPEGSLQVRCQRAIFS